MNGIVYQDQIPWMRIERTQFSNRFGQSQTSEVVQLNASPKKDNELDFGKLFHAELQNL